MADVDYVAAEIVGTAYEAIHAQLLISEVSFYCNQLHSRHTSIALIYLSRYITILSSIAIDGATAAFGTIYPTYAAAREMADYVQLNRENYQFAG